MPKKTDGPKKIVLDISQADLDACRRVLVERLKSKVLGAAHNDELGAIYRAIADVAMLDDLVVAGRQKDAQ